MNKSKIKECAKCGYLSDQNGYCIRCWERWRKRNIGQMKKRKEDNE